MMLYISNKFFLVNDEKPKFQIYNDMGTVISFTTWLQKRDVELAESIKNESFRGWLPHLAMMGALGVAGGKSALPEIPHHSGHEESPIESPAIPKLPGHGKPHAPAPGGGDGGHDNTDELAHYVADQQMRKLRGLKAKAGGMMDRYGGFGYYLKLFASRFFRQAVPTIRHLGEMLVRTPQTAAAFFHHLEEDVHELIEKMGGDLEPEGTPEFMAPWITKKYGGFAGGERLEDRPYFAGGRGDFTQAMPPKMHRIYRHQHRGG